MNEIPYIPLLISGGPNIEDNIYVANAECFAGSNDILQRYDCINFDSKILSDQKPAVLLHNFQYGQESKETIINLDIEVHLTIKEAFFIFSNICSNIYYWHYWNLPADDTFVKNIYKQNFIMEKITDSLLKVVKDFTNIQVYTYNYLIYIYDQLLAEHLSPLELLRLNGAPTLAIFHALPSVSSFLNTILSELNNFEDVHESRKILYLQYLLHLHRDWLDDNLRKEISLKIEQLKKFVFKEFYEVELNKTLFNQTNHKSNKKE